jgi:hypothetical protein
LSVAGGRLWYHLLMPPGRARSGLPSRVTQNGYPKKHRGATSSWLDPPSTTGEDRTRQSTLLGPIVQRWDGGNAKMKVVTVRTATLLIALVTLGTGTASAQSAGAAGDSSMILELLPFVIISAMLACGNYFLAVKSGRSGILYVILAFIPLVGFIATGYLIFTSLYRALDQKRVPPDGAPRG